MVASERVAEDGFELGDQLEQRDPGAEGEVHRAVMGDLAGEGVGDGVADGADVGEVPCLVTVAVDRERSSLECGGDE